MTGIPGRPGNGSPGFHTLLTALVITSVEGSGHQQKLRSLSTKNISDFLTFFCRVLHMLQALSNTFNCKDVSQMSLEGRCIRSLQHLVTAQPGQVRHIAFSPSVD